MELQKKTTEIKTSDQELCSSVKFSSSNLTSYFVEYFTDDRVADWPLMSAYWPTFALTAAYLVIVYVGPKFMTSRPPFEFRWTLFLYNAGLVALNFHICFEVCQQIHYRGYY